jgi:hypothetical protein
MTSGKLGRAAKQLRQRTTDPLPVWEDPTGAKEVAWTPLKLKDRIQEQEVNGRDVANTNARLRLKWAMDYWVALWFWPIRQAGSLPSRDTWLLELSMILGDLEQGVAPELGQGPICRHPTQTAGGGFQRPPRLCGCAEAQG